MIYLKNNTDKQDCFIPKNLNYEGKKTYKEGVEYQKSLIEPITITENGTYENENGFNPVIVDVSSTITTYPTIKDIYNTEDISTEVYFKGTVAVCLQYSLNYRVIVTDHTGAFYIDTNQPYDVGDECIFTGVVRKNSTNIRYMQRPVVEVISKGNYVVMPVDAVELTNISDLYIPNEYGNAEMKYLYYEGVVETFNSNGNIRITTPESVSERGYISLLASKEEWRSDLAVGDYVRVYMFPASSNGAFIPTDLIKLGTESGECPELTTIDITENGSYEGAFSLVNVNVPQEGSSCNLEDKWVTPSMGEMDDNGFIVVNPSEGYDGMSRTVIDPQTIYNEGVEEGRNQGGGSGECNIQNQKRVDLSSEFDVIYPDEGYDGVYEVVVDAGRRAEEWQEQGKNEIINKLQSIEITENGRYSTDEQELRSYIEFDGNSYFDTTIQFGENTKIEVAITKTTFEESEQVIGVANYDLLTAETYGGFGIVIGAGLIYGVFGKAKTNNIPYSFEEEQIITLDRNGLNSSLYGETGWSDESGLIDVGIYGQTIGLGKIKSVMDGWSGVFKGRIRYVKIWTDRNDDTTMTLFRPKNMAQGGFGLVNSEGVEYNYIENLGTGTTTYIQEYVNKYGYGWKEINVNVPTIKEQIRDYYYCPLIIASAGFGEAAENWDENDVILNNYDGNVIENVLYIPTFGNRNEFRTKEKVRFVQRIDIPSDNIGSIEFSDGVEFYVNNNEGNTYTNLTKIVLGIDMETLNFGSGDSFPAINEIWDYSTTEEFDVFISTPSNIKSGGTLYLKTQSHESEWRINLPEDWTIKYI